MLSIRINPNSPNHHLWWNRGSWWIHATIHHPDSTKQRIRAGLQTKDITIARVRRDSFLSQTLRGGGK